MATPPGDQQPLEGTHVFFGGSFSPPHVGHQLACLYLLEGLGAARVVVAPCGQHAFGKALAPFANRLAMCQAMAEPLGTRCEVSDVEGRHLGVSRTVETLERLRAAQKQPTPWAFVVGADLVPELHRWHRFADLLASARPIVLQRAGYTTQTPLHVAALGDEVVLAPVALPEISSTALRQRLAAGQSLAGWVPRGVAALLT